MPWLRSLGSPAGSSFSPCGSSWVASPASGSALQSPCPARPGAAGESRALAFPAGLAEQIPTNRSQPKPGSASHNPGPWSPCRQAGAALGLGGHSLPGSPCFHGLACVFGYRLTSGGVVAGGSVLPRPRRTLCPLHLACPHCRGAEAARIRGRAGSEGVSQPPLGTGVCGAPRSPRPGQGGVLTAWLGWGNRALRLLGLHISCEAGAGQVRATRRASPVAACGQPGMLAAAGSRRGKALAGRSQQPGARLSTAGGPEASGPAAVDRLLRGGGRNALSFLFGCSP